MPANEQSSTIHQIMRSLRVIPEMTTTVDSMSEQNETLNPAGIERAYSGYLKVISDLASLSEEDLAIIRQANQESVKLGASENASDHGADTFIATMREGNQRTELTDVISTNNTDSEIFKNALDDLIKRMKMGSDRASKDLPNIDGDKDADYAIWGHTKGLSQKALIHLALCHFLARTFAAAYIHSSDPKTRILAEQKDSLISAMGDVIKLRTAQGTSDPEIAKMWLDRKEEGGLGWNSRARQEIYNTTVQQMS